MRRGSLKVAAFKEREFEEGCMTGQAFREMLFGRGTLRDTVWKEKQFEGRCFRV